MLPSIIEKLEDAEELDRKHYERVSETGSPNYGKYRLQLDGKHPVQLKNTELLTSVSTLTGEVQKIGAEKTKLELKVLPDGKIAADPSVVELGETAFALGLKTKKDVEGLKTRAETAEQKLNREAEEKLNAEVAAAIGKNPSAWAEHVTARGLTFKKTTVKDDAGNEVTNYTVVSKGDDGKDVETPLKDYATQKASHVAAGKPPKRKFGVPNEEGESGDENEFDQIRKEMDEKLKTNATKTASFADTFFGNAASSLNK